ncbi:hypothetical protein NQ318_006418 [Aromia moschata]|uniref:Mariner Mos1 transposase n=1 Tax=Aromia moschata TaxID=1265417 RepID=A0AAV8X7A8_9CUCU|nr:hypothetical protein NQ318_006418 [Aromia moschata]
MILLHDNARLYTANLMREKLEEVHWTTLEHTPYCPDLSPYVKEYNVLYTDGSAIYPYNS